MLSFIAQCLPLFRKPFFPKFSDTILRSFFFLFAQTPRFALIPFVLSLCLIALQLWFSFRFCAVIHCCSSHV